MLNSVKDKVPAEVFTTPYTNPVGGTPDKVRGNLREAVRLLKEAGYEVRDQKLVNAKTGEPFTVEFLASDPELRAFRAVLQAVARSPRHRASRCAPSTSAIREPAAPLGFRRHHRESWGQSLSPGNEQRGFWGSQAADQSGSRNLVGIKNPAIDALIDRVIFAKSRAELVAASKALDRVLLWN